MDSSGVSRSIECDDHEALLVGSWIRTSAWLQPHLQDRFHMELEQEVQQVEQVRRQSPSAGHGGQGHMLLSVLIGYVAL